MTTPFSPGLLICGQDFRQETSISFNLRSPYHGLENRNNLFLPQGNVSKL